MSTFSKIGRQLEGRREGLGMSRRDVAKRSGVSLPTIHRILSGKELNPSLQNVNAIANALGFELQLSETQNVHQFRKAQATAKAKRLVGMLQGTMALEAQAVDAKKLNEMVEQTMCELLTGPQRKLWAS